MADLFSRYSESAAAHPPLDALEPKPVSFAGKTATAVQDDDGGARPRGRTRITVNFDNPTENADSLDGALVKGPPGEGDVQADLTYDPVVVGKEKVFAASKFGGPGAGDSKAAAGAPFGTRSLVVASPVNFAVGQTIRILTELGFAFARVKVIVGNTLEFEHDVNLDVPPGAPVQTVNDKAPLARGVDYDWADPSLGLITIHDTPATAGKHIGVEYATTLEDFAGGDVILLSGQFPYPDYADAEDILNDPAAEVVGTWAPGQNQFTLDRVLEAIFGRIVSIYFIAKDREAKPNRSLARGFPVTVLPPIPTGLKTETGHSRVTLFWDDLAAGGGLVDGYDVMRSAGASFVPTSAKKLNAGTILVPKFTDQAGAPNRVPEAQAPAPVNCNTYSYAVVSKIGSNLWDVPTSPVTADSPGNPVAIKKLADLT